MSKLLVSSLGGCRFGNPRKLAVHSEKTRATWIGETVLFLRDLGNGRVAVALQMTDFDTESKFVIFDQALGKRWLPGWLAIEARVLTPQKLLRV